MKIKKWFSIILAAIFALGLAGAASAQCGGGGCGRGAGRGACYAQADKGTCPNYQQGQGRKRGQGRQQCLRGSNCPVTPPNAAPASPPAATPAN